MQDKADKNTFYCDSCWRELSAEEKEDFIKYAINKYILAHPNKERLQAFEKNSEAKGKALKELTKQVEELNKSVSELKETAKTTMEEKNKEIEKYRKQVDSLTELNKNLSNSIKVAIATNKDGWQKTFLKVEEILNTLKAYEG